MTIKTIEIENEKVYLKKDWLGWRTVEPIRDPETNKFILKNFLSKKGFIMLLFIIAIIALGYFAFQEQIKNYNTIMEDPCRFCEDCADIVNEFTNYIPNLGGEV